ncbi:MAG TPA: hypothetical protein VEC17_00740 [Candidatus Binatia bacterium]|nr:hypothetical protein [Candidatus Binatia bacterium]
MKSPKEIYIAMVSKLRAAKSLEEYSAVQKEYFSVRMLDLNNKQSMVKLEELQSFLDSADELNEIKEVEVKEFEVILNVGNNTHSMIMENGSWKYDGNSDYKRAWAHMGEY